MSGASAEAESEGPRRGPFVEPVRRIMTAMDMGKWEASQAYANLMGFIMAVNRACVGRTRTELEGQTPSPSVVALVAVFDALSALVDEIPAVQQPMRFGNAAFVTWLDRMGDQASALVASVLAADPGQDAAVRDAVIELVPYFTGSFGNRQRRDYGTGHEMSMVAFLGGLTLLGVLGEADMVWVGLHVFGTAYLGLARKLQTVYSLEPAGSRGSYGLDDYQFMPFLWGSAQLIDHASITPGSVLDEEIVRAGAADYLYLDAVRYILSLKTGPFAEHSSVLHSITSVAHWTKVNDGMIKMYKGEVLRKFPVVQHIVFGSLYTLDRSPHMPGAGAAGAASSLLRP